MEITDLTTAYTTWIRISIAVLRWVLEAAQAVFSTTYVVCDCKSCLWFFDMLGCSLYMIQICIPNQLATSWSVCRAGNFQDINISWLFLLFLTFTSFKDLFAWKNLRIYMMGQAKHPSRPGHISNSIHRKRYKNKPGLGPCFPTIVSKYVC